MALILSAEQPLAPQAAAHDCCGAASTQPPMPVAFAAVVGVGVVALRVAAVTLPSVVLKGVHPDETMQSTTLRKSSSSATVRLLRHSAKQPGSDVALAQPPLSTLAIAQCIAQAQPFVALQASVSFRHRFSAQCVLLASMSFQSALLSQWPLQ